MSVRFKNARVEKMPLNIRLQWNAGTACVPECMLKIRESLCESGEGVRLPRERRWPPGKSRNFRGSLGNFRGSSGLLLSSTVRELPGKSPKTSGKFGELLGKSGDFPEARGSLTPYQWLAKCVSKKKLACRGLRVGPSKSRTLNSWLLEL